MGEGQYESINDVHEGEGHVKTYLYVLEMRDRKKGLIQLWKIETKLESEGKEL